MLLILKLKSTRSTCTPPLTYKQMHGTFMNACSALSHRLNRTAAEAPRDKCSGALDQECKPAFTPNHEEVINKEVGVGRANLDHQVHPVPERSGSSLRTPDQKAYFRPIGSGKPSGRSPHKYCRRTEPRRVSSVIGPTLSKATDL
jgi:hypothetical protein